MLRFSCPKCTQIIECPDTNAGKKVACPICKAQLQVPAVSAPARAEPKSKAPARSGRDTEPVDDLEEVTEAETPEPRRSRREEKEEEPLDVEPAHPSSRRRDEEPEDLEEEEEAPRKKKGKSEAKSRLGKRLKTYEPSTGSLIAGMVFAVLLMAAGLGFLAGSVIARNPGLIVVSIILIPLGLGLFFLWFHMLGLKVMVHDGGLVHANRNNERIIPWDDIEYVWQQITEHYTNGVYTGTTYVYSLQLYDGSRLKYTNNSLKNVQKLGEAILHETSQVLYPKAMTKFNKGKTVKFGSLGVSQDGLSYGSSLLDWKEIDGVRIKQGYVSVRKKGKWLNWCNIAVASIPNLYVFLSLVNQIVGIDNG